jgi:hypothetical protein
MTVWEILAAVVTGWVLVAGSSWLVFVAITRARALRALDARRRESIDRAAAMQQSVGGGWGEGTGPAPTDAMEAAMEARAQGRSRGLR